MTTTRNRGVGTAFEINKLLELAEKLDDEVTTRAVAIDEQRGVLWLFSCAAMLANWLLGITPLALVPEILVALGGFQLLIRDLKRRQRRDTRAKEQTLEILRKELPTLRNAKQLSILAQAELDIRLRRLESPV